MTDEELKERIKLCKMSGTVIIVVAMLFAASMVVLGATLSEPGQSRFTMLMISAAGGALTALFAGLTFLRINRLKSRKSLNLGYAGLIVSVLVMIVMALVSLLMK